MKTTSVLFFVLTITTISTASFAGNPKGIPEDAVQMNAEMMQQFFPGKIIVGKADDGGEYKDIYNPDNTFAGHTSGGEQYINWKWSIRDKKKDKKDSLCFKGGGQNYCYKIWSDGGSNIYYVYKGRVYPAKVVEEN